MRGMGYLSPYRRTASRSKNSRYAWAPISSLSALAACPRQLWSFFQAYFAARPIPQVGASGVSTIIVRGLPIGAPASHARNASDVSSTSQVEPDCRAASPNAPRCAAFSNVERSRCRSELISAIVFMLLALLLRLQLAFPLSNTRLFTALKCFDCLTVGSEASRLKLACQVHLRIGNALSKLCHAFQSFLSLSRKKLLPIRHPLRWCLSRRRQRWLLIAASPQSGYRQRWSSLPCRPREEDTHCPVNQSMLALPGCRKTCKLVPLSFSLSLLAVPTWYTSLIFRNYGIVKCFSCQFPHRRKTRLGGFYEHFQ